jgi:hypothetical protein
VQTSVANAAAAEKGEEWTHVAYWQILLQKSKIDQPQKLAKVDFWTSLLLRRFSTPLRKSVIDFG